MAESPESRRQSRLEERLNRLLGVGAATFYHDARGISIGELASRGNLLGHLIREIDSALFQAMSPLVGPAPPREEDLTSGGRLTRRERAQAIANALRLDQEAPEVASWIANSFHGQAHRSNLGPPRPLDPRSLDVYEAFLERALDSLEAEYGRVFEQLDQLLATGPAGHVMQLCDLPPGSHEVALKYFFDRATVDWLGYIPKCVISSRSVAGFLARIASDNPEKTSEVIRSVLAASPDDQRTHADLAWAATQLPGPLVATFARTEAPWVRSQPWLGHPLSSRLVDAAAALLDANEPEAALDLSSALLALGGLTGDRWGAPPIRFYAGDYEDLLANVVPRLTRALPHETFELLLPIVKEVAVAAGDTRLSSLWLHAVSDHSQDRPSDLRTLLVRALRDAAVELAKVSGAKFVLERLLGEALTSNILLRIALHVIRRLRDVENAVAWLENPDIEQLDLSREAYELVFDLRSDLLVADRERVLAAIESGHLAESARNAIRGLLDSAAVVDAEPNPHVGLLMEVVVGMEPPPSPFSPEDLNQRSVDEVVDLVLAWGVEDEFDRADLGSVFIAAIGAAPERYVQGAAALMRLPPQAVSLALRAFEQATTDAAVSNWSPLLGALERRMSDDALWRTPPWQLVRSSLASFVCVLLARRPPGLLPGAHEDIWALVAALAGETPPRTDQEASRDHEGLLSLMLSETRPRAVQAALYFARWVMSDTDAGLPARVQELLDFHVDPKQESSLAVRAMFGWELPLLVGLDKRWVLSREDRLFPAGDDVAILRRAVWDAYLYSPHGVRFEAVRVLRREWESWASELSATVAQIDERAGEQFLVCYWHGQVDREDPILAMMFANAPVSLRAELLSWVGWQLRQVPEASLDPAVEARLRSLWEWRAMADGVTARELGTFGRWFASSQLNLTWTLPEIERIVHADAPLDDLDEVLVRLSESLATEPVRIGTLVDRIVSQEVGNDKLILASDEVAAVAVALLNDADSEAREVGRRLENRMRSRGFVDPGVSRVRPPRRRRVQRST